MKQKFLYSLSLLILFSLFAGCKDDSLGTDGPDLKEENGEPNFPNVTVLYPYEAYVGAVSPEMRETLDATLSNTTGSISEFTRLIILGSLNEIDSNTLETAYLNGATIAVENPKVADFEALFTMHPDWNGYVSGTPLELALLFSFDKDDCALMVNKPSQFDFSTGDYDDGIEEEEIDPSLLKGEEIIPEFENPTPEYYFYLRPWLNHLAEDEKVELDSGSSTEFDDFSSAQHIHTSFEFDLDPVVRKIASSKPDSIKDAKVKVDVNLSVHQIHVYEKAAGEGNYYIVYNDTEFNSDEAYKGIFHHRHGGVHVKGVGFYAKELRVSFKLLQNDGTEANVIFPGICPPEPDNQNNVTSYSKTSSFNVGGSLSVSGGYGKEGPKAELKAGVSLGWAWSRQISANISDVSVLKVVDGNKAGWKLEFNNTPYFDTSHKYWINLGTNNNSRASQSLRSAWVWYEPDGKDDDNRKPLKIKISVDGEYEAASYYATKADWKKVTKRLGHYVSEGNKIKFTPGKESIVELSKTLETRSIGRIVLKNNFPNSYIDRIKIYSKSKLDTLPEGQGEDLVLNKVASYGPKAEIDLGYHFSKDVAYKLIFYAKEVGKEVDEEYHYELYHEKWFDLEKGKTLQLNAPNDFKKQ